MRFLLLLLVALAFPGSPAFAAKRVGFVVGVNSYPKLGAERQLVTARQDASLIAATLRQIGFDHVDEATDVTRSEFNRRFAAFLSRIEPGDAAFFFFAGHGIGLSTGNFFLPSDVPAPETWDELTIEETPIAEAFVIDRIQKRGARLVILVVDACRNNPLEVGEDSPTRSLGMQSRGLVEPPKAVGVFSIYAAGIGQEALDRLDDNDANSVFTRVFAQKLAEPGRHLADIAVDVREAVAELAAKRIDPATGKPHQQNVGYYDQTRGGRIFLNGEAPSAPAGVAAGGALAEDFEVARQLGTAEAWEAFLERHGGGADLRVGLARKALEKFRVASLPDAAPAPAAETPSDEVRCKAALSVVPEPFGSMRRRDAEVYERACLSALADQPANPELQASLGRTLVSLQRYDEALKRLQSAADAGHPRARTVIGVMQGTGIGVPEDKAKAIENLKQALLLGDSLARVFIEAEKIVDGSSSETRKEGLATLQSLAKTSDPVAAYFVASASIRQIDGAPPIAEAMEMLRRSASNGDGIARFGLVMAMEQNTEGVAHDPEQAAALIAEGVKANPYVAIIWTTTAVAKLISSETLDRLRARLAAEGIEVKGEDFGAALVELAER